MISIAGRYFVFSFFFVGFLSNAFGSSHLHSPTHPHAAGAGSAAHLPHADVNFIFVGPPPYIPAAKDILSPGNIMDGVIKMEYLLLSGVGSPEHKIEIPEGAESIIPQATTGTVHLWVLPNFVPGFRAYINEIDKRLISKLAMHPSHIQVESILDLIPRTHGAPPTHVAISEYDPSEVLKYGATVLQTYTNPMTVDYVTYKDFASLYLIAHKGGWYLDTNVSPVIENEGGINFHFGFLQPPRLFSAIGLGKAAISEPTQEREFDQMYLPFARMPLAVETPLLGIFGDTHPLFPIFIHSSLKHSVFNVPAGSAEPSASGTMYIEKVGPWLMSGPVGGDSVSHRALAINAVMYKNLLHVRQTEDNIHQSDYVNAVLASITYSIVNALYPTPASLFPNQRELTINGTKHNIYNLAEKHSLPKNISIPGCEMSEGNGLSRVSGKQMLISPNLSCLELATLNLEKVSSKSYAGHPTSGPILPKLEIKR